MSPIACNSPNLFCRSATSSACTITPSKKPVTAGSIGSNATKNASTLPVLFSDLAAFVKSEYQANKVFPPAKLIFNSFDHCPFKNLKVVILGQDEIVTVAGVQYGDADADNEVDASETGELNEDAVGLEVSNVDFGFVLMTPTAAALPGFAKILPKMHAFKGTAASASLVGMDGILEASLEMS